MARIAMLVPPFVGHLNPMTALGRTLQARGHEVTIVGMADAGSRVARAGLPFLEIGAKRFPAGAWEREVQEIGRWTGPPVMRGMLRMLLAHARAVVDDLPAVLIRERFDGLVMDQFCYGAEAVAQSTGTPLALACAALPFHRESSVPLFFRDWPHDPSVWGRVRNQTASFANMLWGWRVAVFYFRHRCRLGLWPPSFSHMNEVPPSLVQVAQVPECLDFPRRSLPRHFHYTGPWVDDGRRRLERGSETGAAFPWDRLDGRRVIYASLGTLQNGVGSIYETIAAACAGVDAQLVIARGRESADAPPDWPGRPLVVGYAPQLELLARASLVITHAGLNTALETARAGVPMVAIPIAHDQPGVAARLQHHGLARMIPLAELEVDRLRAAVGEVMGNPAFARRAGEISALIQPLDGPGTAASLIERAFTNRRCVWRE